MPRRWEYFGIAWFLKCALNTGMEGVFIICGPVARNLFKRRAPLGIGSRYWLPIGPVFGRRIGSIWAVCFFQPAPLRSYHDSFPWFQETVCMLPFEPHPWYTSVLNCYRHARPFYPKQQLNFRTYFYEIMRFSQLIKCKELIMTF
jgi:hypothetical protein